MRRLVCISAPSERVSAQCSRWTVDSCFCYVWYYGDYVFTEGILILASTLSLTVLSHSWPFTGLHMSWWKLALYFIKLGLWGCVVFSPHIHNFQLIDYSSSNIWKSWRRHIPVSHRPRRHVAWFIQASAKSQRYESEFFPSSSWICWSLYAS